MWIKVGVQLKKKEENFFFIKKNNILNKFIYKMLKAISQLLAGYFASLLL